VNEDPVFRIGQTRTQKPETHNSIETAQRGRVAPASGDGVGDESCVASSDINTPHRSLPDMVEEPVLVVRVAQGGVSA
jgi:hypothetical protein